MARALLSGRAWSVAAALASAVAARADEHSPAITVYGPNNSVTPAYRVWSGSWGAAQSCPAITSYAHWVVARNCPTRNETACMILDENRDLHVMFYIGEEGGGSEQWTMPELLCTNVGMSFTERACDMVYENSGDLLVAYWNATEQMVAYRHGAGGFMSGEGLLDIAASSDVRWLCLVQAPKKNKVILLAVDTNERLYGAVWGGSGFFAAELLCADLSTDQRQGFHAGFEGLSGEGLIAYCSETNGVLLYRTVSGNVIGPQQTGPTFAAVDHYWVRLAGSPTTDQVVAVTLNSSKELKSAAWDGDAWGGVTTIATGLQYDDRRNYDVAWQADGAQCLAVFANAGNGMRRFATWNGSVWSGVSSVANVGSTTATFSLFPDDSGENMFVFLNDTGNDLETSRWNGGSLSTHSQLNGTIEGGQKAQSYSVAVPVTAGPQEETERDIRIVQWREVGPD